MKLSRALLLLVALVTLFTAFSAVTRGYQIMTMHTTADCSDHAFSYVLAPDNSTTDHDCAPDKTGTFYEKAKSGLNHPVVTQSHAEHIQYKNGAVNCDNDEDVVSHRIYRTDLCIPAGEKSMIVKCSETEVNIITYSNQGCHKQERVTKFPLQCTKTATSAYLATCFLQPNAAASLVNTTSATVLMTGLVALLLMVLNMF